VRVTLRGLTVAWTCLSILSSPPESLCFSLAGPETTYQGLGFTLVPWRPSDPCANLFTVSTNSLSTNTCVCIMKHQCEALKAHAQRPHIEYTKQSWACLTEGSPSGASRGVSMGNPSLGERGSSLGESGSASLVDLLRGSKAFEEATETMIVALCLS
jgi:hypothetical protein